MRARSFTKNKHAIAVKQNAAASAGRDGTDSERNQPASRPNEPTLYRL